MERTDLAMATTKKTKKKNNKKKKDKQDHKNVWWAFAFVCKRFKTNENVIETFLCLFFCFSPFSKDCFLVFFPYFRFIYLIINSKSKSMVFIILWGCFPYSNDMVHMVHTMVHLTEWPWHTFDMWSWLLIKHPYAHQSR